MAPTDVAPRIDVARIELLSGTVVEAADIEHQERVAHFQIGRGHAVQRTVLVDEMKQGPAQHEHRMFVAVERKLIEAAQLVAFATAFGADEPKPRTDARDRVVPRVGGADHQGLPAVAASDHGVIGEHEAGARAREAREDQPGHHRQKAHAGENLDRGDQMPVVGLRVHVAVADRRQRLDREIEVRQRPVAFGIGDRLVAEPIEKTKDRVQRDEQRRRTAEKHRPVDRHRPMIKIAPEALTEAESFDLAMAVANDLRLCLGSSPRSCRWLLASKLWQWKRPQIPSPIPARGNHEGYGVGARQIHLIPPCEDERRHASSDSRR